MRVDVEHKGEIAIVSLNEPRLDYSNSDRWAEILQELAADSPRAIIVDMHSVLYIDSRGLLPFLSAQAALNPGGVLRLCGISSHLEQSLRHMNFHKILKIHDTLEDAIEAADSENSQ